MRISDWSSDVCSSDLPRGFFEYADALLDVRLHAAAEAFAEQFFLAAEIIINGGAIEAGLEPDLGKLGGAIALRLELIGGDRQQFRALRQIFGTALLQGRGAALGNIRSLDHADIRSSDGALIREPGLSDQPVSLIACRAFIQCALLRHHDT